MVDNTHRLVHLTRLVAIDLPGTTPGHPAADIADSAKAAGIEGIVAPSLEDALGSISGASGRVLVCGSLYLAGNVLAAETL